jgi:hypothetical protein
LPLYDGEHFELKIEPYKTPNLASDVTLEILQVFGKEPADEMAIPDEACLVYPSAITVVSADFTQAFKNGHAQSFMITHVPGCRKLVARIKWSLSEEIMTFAVALKTTSIAC